MCEIHDFAAVSWKTHSAVVSFVKAPESSAAGRSQAMLVLASGRDSRKSVSVKAGPRSVSSSGSTMACFVKCWRRRHMSALVNICLAYSIDRITLFALTWCTSNVWSSSYLSGPSSWRCNFVQMAVVFKIRPISWIRCLMSWQASLMHVTSGRKTIIITRMKMQRDSACRGTPLASDFKVKNHKTTNTQGCF